MYNIIVGGKKGIDYFLFLCVIFEVLREATNEVQ